MAIIMAMMPDIPSTTAVSYSQSAVPLHHALGLFLTRESVHQLGWPVPVREQSDSEPPSSGG